jgi:hypothetical protein
MKEEKLERNKGIQRVRSTLEKPLKDPKRTASPAPTITPPPPPLITITVTQT